MEYFKIGQEKTYRNILRPLLPTMSQIWGEEKPLLVHGKAEKSEEDIRFLPFYQANVLSGAFLISKKMGDIWKKYQYGGRYRPCVFGHVETRNLETYYLMYPRLLNVLHKDTVYLKDGEIEQICLCRELVEIHRVFGIKGKHRTDIVVAGDVLEEMLKEEIVGFQAVPVSVKEGTPWQKNMWWRMQP